MPIKEKFPLVIGHLRSWIFEKICISSSFRGKKVGVYTAHKIFCLNARTEDKLDRTSPSAFTHIYPLPVSQPRDGFQVVFFDCTIQDSLGEEKGERYPPTDQGGDNTDKQCTYNTPRGWSYLRTCFLPAFCELHLIRGYAQILFAAQTRTQSG